MKLSMLHNVPKEIVVLTSIDSLKRQLSTCMVDGDIDRELFLSNLPYIQEQAKIFMHCLNELNPEEK